MKQFSAPERVRDALRLDQTTMERLSAYADLLIRWQAKINLVGPDTLPDLWERHILDSAQLRPLIPSGCQRLADLGSGAGFPGLVLAILGAPDPHLVESDARKAAFLREVARVTGTAVTLHVNRIEAVDPLMADVVTARALAPLEKLLPWARRHLAPGGLGLFPKGKGVEDELTAVQKEGNIRFQRVVSVTDPSASIVLFQEG